MCVVSHRNLDRTTKCACLQVIHQLENLLSLICKITVGLSHIGCQKQLDAFVSTYIQSSSKISFILCTTGKEIVEKKQKIPHLNCEVS